MAVHLDLGTKQPKQAFDQFSGGQSLDSIIRQSLFFSTLGVDLNQDSNPHPLTHIRRTVTLEY